MSAVQPSDPVIHIYISILSEILFPHRLSQNMGTVLYAIEQVPFGQSSHIPQCAYANPQLPVHPYSPPVPFGNYMFFKVCESVSVLQIDSFVSIFFFFF